MKRNTKTIASSALVVMVVTFIIKLLGLVKQSVLAAYCGATNETDAFFIASGVLVSLATMFFSAISISLLTLHTKKLVEEGSEEANNLVNAALREFIPVSIFISLLFALGAPLVARCLAPTYQAEQLELLAHYIRIMSVVFVLWCYYLTVNVILETDKDFLPGRMQGFFQNIFLIISTVFLFGSWGMETLVWSFILSGVVECILVTWCARKRFKFVFGKITTPKVDVIRLFTLSIPLILGNALYEINDIVDKQISSALGTGNVSYLTYGSTINDIVVGVIVTSISTVIFSHFATWAAKGNREKIQATLNKSIEILAILIFPIMSMCLFAGDDILQVLYGRGNFGEDEVRMTQTVVIGYAIGFLFSAIRSNTVKVFYAFQDTRRPLYNGVISIVVNITLSIVLSRYIGVCGVSLATSMAMIVSSLLLMRQLKSHMPAYKVGNILPECMKGFVGFGITSVLIFLANQTMSMNVWLKFVMEGVMCVGVYVVVLYLLKSRCLQRLSLVRGR